MPSDTGGPGCDCGDITEKHLASIISLDLSNKGITTLKAYDFDGLSSLETLNLSDNFLSSLPVGIFDELASLKCLQLHGNSVDPLSVTVSLEKTGDDQFKAVVPIGAPFDIVLPLNINGRTITTRDASIRIFTGRTESESLGEPLTEVLSLPYVLKAMGL